MARKELTLDPMKKLKYDGKEFDNAVHALNFYCGRQHWKDTKHIAKILKMYGAESIINQKHNGKTALLTAASTNVDIHKARHSNAKRYLAILKLLMKNGADIKATDNNGVNAFMHFTSRYKSDSQAVGDKREYVTIAGHMLFWLTGIGLINEIFNRSRTRDFLYTTSLDVNFLLDASDPKFIGLSDKKGDTALAHAAKNGNAPLIGILVGKGANPEKVNNNLVTPLMHSVRTSDKSSMNKLLKLGVDTAKQDEIGRTAIGYGEDSEYFEHKRNAQYLAKKLGI